jgi:hypothetical protein
VRYNCKRGDCILFSGSYRSPASFEAVSVIHQQFDKLEAGNGQQHDDDQEYQ